MKKAKQEKKIKPRMRIKIWGVSLWRILGYFIIYSFLGYLVEVLYGIVTKGVIESRQSFLYGPFCGIYGLGAILMILPFKKFNKANRLQIFSRKLFNWMPCRIFYKLVWRNILTCKMVGLYQLFFEY